MGAGNAHLDGYLTFYNAVRPHSPLNVATPMACVTQTPSLRFW